MGQYPWCCLWNAVQNWYYWTSLYRLAYLYFLPFLSSAVECNVSHPTVKAVYTIIYKAKCNNVQQPTKLKSDDNNNNHPNTHWCSVFTYLNTHSCTLRIIIDHIGIHSKCPHLATPLLVGTFPGTFIYWVQTPQNGYYPRQTKMGGNLKVEFDELVVTG